MSTATPGSSADTQDSWGLPSTQLSNAANRVPQHAAPVPDDWDAEDDGSDEEVDSPALWETANSRAPMPQIQPSSTFTAAGAQLPPAAAFEAPMRILKRPSAGSAKSSPLNGGQQTQISFKDREAQYQAARERIFGEEKTKSADCDSSPRATRVSDKQGIIRDPIGPTSEDTDEERKRGFGKRKKKAGTDDPPRSGNLEAVE